MVPRSLNSLRTGGDAGFSSTHYGGMTVNERLCVSGLINEFDTTVRRRDRDAMISILMKVALSPKGAAWTADTILANPAHYGY